MDLNQAHLKGHTNLFIKETLESNEKEERLHAIFMWLINIFLTCHLDHITLEKCGINYSRAVRNFLIYSVFMRSNKREKEKKNGYTIRVGLGQLK